MRKPLLTLMVLAGILFSACNVSASNAPIQTDGTHIVPVDTFYYYSDSIAYYPDNTEMGNYDIVGRKSNISLSIHNDLPRVEVQFGNKIFAVDGVKLLEVKKKGSTMFSVFSSTDRKTGQPIILSFMSNPQTGLQSIAINDGTSIVVFKIARILTRHG